MCVQYIPLETRSGVSPIKVGLMAIMPFVLMTHFQANKAFFLSMLYLAWIFFVAAGLYPETFRASTLLYTGMFVITFIVVYTAIVNYEVFNLEEFRTFMIRFFYVLVVVLLIQQFFILIGIKYFPLINLCQILNRGIGANSLTFEPSTLGRLLAVMYYAILKLTEYQQGEKVSLQQAFEGNLKWISIGYAWCVVTMGSGTAFLAAGITSLYFMRGWGFLSAIPIFVVIFFILESSGNESFERVQAAAQATMTGDAEMVRQADGSASTRIAPMLNTFHADFTSTDFWIGKGTDSTNWWDFAMGRGYIGHINDYGFISYILELLIVFGCCIRFRSLGTLYFFTGTGGGIGNISYGWGILMVFCCLRFFYYKRSMCEEKEDEEYEYENLISNNEILES